VEKIDGGAVQEKDVGDATGEKVVGGAGLEEMGIGDAGSEEMVVDGTAFVGSEDGRYRGT